MFDRAYEYQHEVGAYISARDDEDLYYNQKMEKYAREYGLKASQQYRVSINQYLMNNK